MNDNKCESMNDNICESMNGVNENGRMKMIWGRRAHWNVSSCEPHVVPFYVGV